VNCMFVCVRAFVCVYVCVGVWVFVDTYVRVFVCGDTHLARVHLLQQCFVMKEYVLV